MVQHYLRPEEMRPFYLQVCVWACVLAGRVAGEVSWCSTYGGRRRRGPSTCTVLQQTPTTT